MHIPAPPSTVPVLRERLPEGMRIEQAAKQIHISRTTLSKVLNAKLNLSALMALRLAAWLGTSSDLCMEMQLQQDLRQPILVQKLRFDLRYRYLSIYWVRMIAIWPRLDISIFFKKNIENSWRNLVMRALPLSKFSSQANPEVLNTLREIAEAEGRKFHAVLDEAFRDYLSKKGAVAPSQKVMTHFAQSLHEFEELYQTLAK